MRSPADHPPWPTMRSPPPARNRPVAGRRIGGSLGSPLPVGSAGTSNDRSVRRRRLRRPPPAVGAHDGHPGAIPIAREPGPPASGTDDGPRPAPDGVASQTALADASAEHGRHPDLDRRGSRRQGDHGRSDDWNVRRGRRRRGGHGSRLGPRRRRGAACGGSDRPDAGCRRSHDRCGTGTGTP